MDPETIVRSGYDTVAAAYLASRTQDSEDVLLLQELLQRLPPNADVLDAGCGAGMPIARLLSRSFHVTGVDFSQEQIRLARELVPEARFLCQDLTRLDLPEGSFDGICSYYAIIHIPREEHAEVLRSFWRLLKPGGWALICLGANDIPEDIDDFCGVTMYWSHYDTETYVAMLKDIGFEIAWARRVEDGTCPGAAHLFVLAQKPVEGSQSTEPKP